MKRIYPHKVKNGAYKIMAAVLKYPEQVDPRMDGKICRITVTSYTIIDNIKKQYQQEYVNDMIWQIKLLDIYDKEFLILQSLIEPLDEVTITDE